jgi:hypothetical protein
MENRLRVLGKTLDPFYKMVVVTFDEKGLVKEWMNYCCRKSRRGYASDDRHGSVP